MDHFASEILAAAWWTYMRPMLALCHIAITASALLITAATFERFLTISKLFNNRVWTGYTKLDRFTKVI